MEAMYFSLNRVEKRTKVWGEILNETTQTLTLLINSWNNRVGGGGRRGPAAQYFMDYQIFESIIHQCVNKWNDTRTPSYRGLEKRNFAYILCRYDGLTYFRFFRHQDITHGSDSGGRLCSCHTLHSVTTFWNVLQFSKGLAVYIVNCWDS
jgi:hypothetical protein